MITLCHSGGRMYTNKENQVLASMTLVFGVICQPRYSVAIQGWFASSSYSSQRRRVNDRVVLSLFLKKVRIIRIMYNEIDFDVDNLDKEFKDNKINNKDVDQIWYKKINKQIDYPRLVIITFCLIVTSFVIYINRRDSILREFEIKNSNFVYNDLYSCDVLVQQKANQLRPVSSIELDNKTEQLNSLGKYISLEKDNLEIIKKELMISPNPSKLEVYKRDVLLFNSRMEDYQSKSLVHKKEIDEYNNKVKLYYDYLKTNCVPN